MRRAIALGFVLTCVALLSSVAAAPACYTHQCDPGPFVVYGTDEAANPPRFDQGHLLAEDAWETTAVDADWIELPPSSGYILYVSRWDKEQRPLLEMHAFISETKHPATADGQNFTEAAGNAAEFSRASNGQVWLYNATCAHFYLRVVLRAGRPLADAGPLTPAPVDAASQ